VLYNTHMPTNKFNFLNKLKVLLVVVVLLLAGTGAGVVYKYPTQTRATLTTWLIKVLKLNTGSTILPQVVVEEESAVIGAVGTVSPAVVSVVAEQTGFNPFSGQTDTEQQGIGTGFIVEATGTILTNKHVVAETSLNYTVVLKDKTSYPAKKVYLDPSNDLAIIKVDASNLPTVVLGDSSSLKVGQTVIAIGNALGRFDNTVTRGVISALGRGITASSGNPFNPQSESLEDVIQTDASLNPGNSGGPLVNLSGQVVGINSAVSTNAQGIGFTIPINVAKPILASFAKNGRIISPYLGVTYQLVTGDLSTFTRLPEGALVRSVVSGSPAEKAGLKKGDVILSVDDQAVTASKSLSQIITAHQVGESVRVVIDRGGAKQTLTAVLAEVPAN
jgi:S1-C subfamily serine protease